MLCSTKVTLLALAASSKALAVPAPIPAGGPQGPISYAPGTILEAAALQPSGNDYLYYNYQGPEASNTYINKNSSSDPLSAINFVTTNHTSAQGYTGLAMRNSTQGMRIVAGVLEVAEGVGMADFAAWDGEIVNHAKAPHGFYYCENPEGAGGSVGAEDAQASHNNGPGGPCSDFSLVLIQQDVYG